MARAQSEAASARESLERELMSAHQAHAAEVDVVTVRLAAEAEKQRLLLENRLALGKCLEPHGRREWGANQCYPREL